MAPIAAGRMDPLNQALSSLRFTGFVHSRNVFTAPWGFRVPGPGEPRPAHAIKGAIQPPAVVAALYAVTAGRCWIQADGDDAPVELRGGDVAWVIGNRGHQLRDSLHTPLRDIHQIVTPRTFENRGGVRHGGGGPATTLVCGAFTIDDTDHHKFLTTLPPLLRLSAHGGDAAPWVSGIVAAMEYEATTSGRGAQGTLDHLARALFSCAVRSHAAELGPGDWMAAIADREIGAALALIRRRPDEPWTVASLARSVSMSRSAFAARFTALVGEPPLRYLKALRMSRARRLLTERASPIKQIAVQSGYGSESAFSTAFKQVHGIAPAAYRRLHRI